MNDNPFDKYYQEYEKWFSENKYVYKSELKAINHFVLKKDKSLEIGVGTGRFAYPLGITTGIDPSQKMLGLAKEKGIDVYQGKGEKLPFPEKSFEFVLIVTTLCFLDNVERTFKEVRRVLEKDGNFIIGFIDRESPLGQKYLKYKEENVFYKQAEFHSTREVLDLLKKHNFKEPEVIQTIFGNLDEINEVQNFKKGYGEGGFIVIKVKK